MRPHDSVEICRNILFPKDMGCGVRCPRFHNRKIVPLLKPLLKDFLFPSTVADAALSFRKSKDLLPMVLPENLIKPKPFDVVPMEIIEYILLRVMTPAPLQSTFVDTLKGQVKFWKTAVLLCQTLSKLSMVSKKFYAASQCYKLQLKTLALHTEEKELFYFQIPSLLDNKGTLSPSTPHALTSYGGYIYSSYPSPLPEVFFRQVEIKYYDVSVSFLGKEVVKIEKDGVLKYYKTDEHSAFDNGDLMVYPDKLCWKIHGTEYASYVLSTGVYSYSLKGKQITIDPSGDKTVHTFGVKKAKAIFESDKKGKLLTKKIYSLPDEKLMAYFDFETKCYSTYYPDGKVEISFQKDKVVKYSATGEMLYLSKSGQSLTSHVYSDILKEYIKFP
jgi:hypothetical protein